eukprot:8002498-Alexandrium_andersonii.AAC.1
MLSRNPRENGSAQRGRVNGSPGRKVLPGCVLALQHGVLVQLRVASRPPLVPAPEAHELQDLGREAHLAGW